MGELILEFPFPPEASQELIIEFPLPFPGAVVRINNKGGVLLVCTFSKFWTLIAIAIVWIRFLHTHY